MRKTKRDRSFMPEAGIAVFTALGLDLLGEPPAAWHPVVWYGRLIHYLEQATPRKPLSQLFYGMLILVLAAPIALLPTAIIHLLARRAHASAILQGNIVGGCIMYALLGCIRFSTGTCIAARVYSGIDAL